MELKQILDSYHKQPQNGLYVLDHISKRGDNEILTEAMTAQAEGLVDFYVQNAVSPIVEKRLLATATGRLLEKYCAVFKEELKNTSSSFCQEFMTEYDFYKHELFGTQLVLPQGLQEGEPLNWRIEGINGMVVGRRYSPIAGLDRTIASTQVLSLDVVNKIISSFGGVPVNVSHPKKPNYVELVHKNESVNYHQMSHSDFITLHSRNSAYPVPLGIDVLVRDKWAIEPFYKKKDFKPGVPTSKKTFLNLDFGEKPLQQFEADYLTNMNLPRRLHNALMKEITLIVKDVADQQFDNLSMNHKKIFKFDL